MCFLLSAVPCILIFGSFEANIIAQWSQPRSDDPR
jgi:hypothetical protein